MYMPTKPKKEKQIYYTKRIKNAKDILDFFKENPNIDPLYVSIGKDYNDQLIISWNILEENKNYTEDMQFYLSQIDKYKLELKSDLDKADNNYDAAIKNYNAKMALIAKTQEGDI